MNVIQSSSYRVPRQFKAAMESDPKLGPWPFYDDDEVKAASRVLQSGRVNYWTGEEGRKFENEYAAHCGVDHGLAVANGTLALELALAGLGIGPGDEVIVPARTFIATASAVAMRGAVPIVADIDPNSQNMTAETLAAALTSKAKAVIPVHLAGWPADMPSIMAVAKDRDLKVIEDCAQAHGAKIDGKTVGSFGDIGCFSFCQDKIISAGGEGGMVVTNDQALYQKMWSHRDHGRDFKKSHTPSSEPGFKWVASTFGTNMRLTEPQSAIGRIQLKKLARWTAMRRANADVLREALKSLSVVTIPEPADNFGHAYYKFCGLFDDAAFKPDWSRDRICNELDKIGVPARVGACPDISREAAFSSDQKQPPHPNAKSIENRTFMLPVHPTLSAENLAFIADGFCRVVKGAIR